MRHACNLPDDSDQRRLLPENLPIPIDEEEFIGSNQLLQRPTSLEPLGIPKYERPITDLVHVVQIHDADHGTHVPGVHGVDGFRKLGAAAFVDTACVHPEIAHAKAVGQSACSRKLAIPVHLLDVDSGHVLERNLIFEPAMR